MKKMTQIGAALASILLVSTAVSTHRVHAQPVPQPEVVWSLDPEVLARQPAVVLIRPSEAKPPGRGGSGMISGSMGTSALGTSLKNIICYAYDVRPPMHNRVIMPADAPAGEYDFIDTVAPDGREALQQLLKQQFGLVAAHEQRTVDALVLTVKTPDAAGLKLSTQDDSGGGGRSSRNGISGENAPIATIAAQIESLLGQPVIDQTGLTGRYDFELRIKTGSSSEIIRHAVADQLGLALTPGVEKRTVDYLVVRKSD